MSPAVCFQRRSQVPGTSGLEGPQRVSGPVFLNHRLCGEGQPEGSPRPLHLGKFLFNWNYINEGFQSSLLCEQKTTVCMNKHAPAREISLRTLQQMIVQPLLNTSNDREAIPRFSVRCRFLHLPSHEGSPILGLWCQGRELKSRLPLPHCRTPGSF